MASIKSVTVTSHVDDVLEELETKIEQAMEGIGSMAEGYAKGVCPVDTGLLRNSITHAISGGAPAISIAYDDDKKKSVTYSGKAPKAKKGKYTVYIGTNVEYAQEQETTEMWHRPGQRAHFLRDSIAQHGEEYKDHLKTALSD